MVILTVHLRDAKFKLSYKEATEIVFLWLLRVKALNNFIIADKNVDWYGIKAQIISCILPNIPNLGLL